MYDHNPFSKSGEINLLKFGLLKSKKVLIINISVLIFNGNVGFNWLSITFFGKVEAVSEVTSISYNPKY